MDKKEVRLTESKFDIMLEAIKNNVELLKGLEGATSDFRPQKIYIHHNGECRVVSISLGLYISIFSDDQAGQRSVSKNVFGEELGYHASYKVVFGPGESWVQTLITR